MKKKKMFVIAGGVILLTLIVSVLLATSTLFSTILDVGGFGLGRIGANVEANEYWEVEINQTLDSRHIEDLGGSEKLIVKLTEQIKKSLSSAYAEQVEFAVKVGEMTEAGVVITTYIRGRDPQIIGPVLYDDLHELFNILAGPIHLTMTGKTKAGSPLTLNMLTNSSTGYGWYMMQKNEAISQKEDRYWAKWEVYPGVPEIQTLDFIFDVSGNVEFMLDYTRPWERSDSIQTIDILIAQSEFAPAFDLIPKDPYFGDLPLNPVVEYESEYKWDDYWVPTSFDWTTDNNRLNKPLTLVIGDQKGCGSCWAFANTGVTEAAYQVQKGSNSFDLSEQYLLSCNQDGYDCDGGSPWVTLAYHIDKNGLSNNQPGAVQETDLPYSPFTATACPTIQNHPVKLASRHWVINDVGNGDDLAYVDELQAAISEFGPIEVKVCASGQFQWYHGGIFDADNCDELNHGVVLVGWDDLTASWILKNSWGPYWGENGYMRIKWGTNRVGVDPIFVIVP